MSFFCSQESFSLPTSREYSIINGLKQTDERGYEMGRSELREHIFKMLFCMEFHSEEAMKEQKELLFDAFENIKEKDMDYILTKYERIAAKLTELDELINENADGWRTKRMNKVDLTVLRLAVYEIKWDEEIPTKVAINEAVELAKKYSSEEAPAFVNGILGNVVK